MGNILHPRATTTPRIRKEIHESTETIAVLAERYSLNHKTVSKWKHRTDFEDRKSGAKKVRSVLSEQEQIAICEFRKLTKLPLDDVFVSLKKEIPKLSRSNLHKCLKRNGLSRLPKEIIETKAKKQFKDYKLGFVHIDIASLRTSEGKAYLFVAIERKTRSVYAELYDNMKVETATLFLKNTIAHFPFKINKILTDNGSQFTYRLLLKRLRPENKVHPFDNVCIEEGIDHRLTKFKHPWTNGLVERMNRTIKEQTVKLYFYETLEDLKKHLMLWLLAYNHQKKLKSLNYISPYDKLLKEYDENKLKFNCNPVHKLQGLNI